MDHIDSKKVFEQIAAKKKNLSRVAGRPHHYGLVDGVHIFHAMHDAHKGLSGLHLPHASVSDENLKDAIQEAKKEGHASVILHGNVPPSLRNKAYPAKHPHNYDWHDGHTDHYLDLEKTEGNEQAAGVGAKSYTSIAEQYGKVQSNKPTNLQFYRGLEHSEPKIDELIEKKGYKTYVAGGPYGKPDLANKNYNTKHLMIYDPTPHSGGDYGHEDFSRSWRKLHELAHAETYDDINKIYGEGRRLGKLGARTPREAKRAVHWEWLAAHKQRELSEQIGHKISDEDFSRELNTIMHDGVHRAITGQFSEPSDEGFTPHPTAVSLEHSLNLIDQHAKKLGLDHDEATTSSKPVPQKVMEAAAITKAEGKAGPLLEGGLIKKFFLDRQQDETGMSGTGRVAEGCVFSNGWVAMNWLSSYGSVCFYPNMEALEKIHSHGGKTKIIYEDIPLTKAFLQHDGETRTDAVGHATALQAIPRELSIWGNEKLVPLNKDEIAVLEFHGKIIKIRKLMDDVYSGWIEDQGQITHQFERVTLPELLLQLQSKFEMYGVPKDEIVADEKSEVKTPKDKITMPLDEVIDEHEKLVDALEKPTPAKLEEEAQEQGKELVDYKEKKEISNKLRELKGKLEEHQETLNGTELVPGIENPEKECPACERPVKDCICYTGLPNPRVEFDGKKVTIFFKSEWQDEDRLNFINDLKRRAGTVLDRRRILKAQDTLVQIRNKLRGK